ncbi:MAG: hypothetical protein D4R64_09985 [Porphyromonadaceae bacterium]|nr:MAG: hypothetical protein D4R64_09985 [Porphyromonadaceae bacterium]
MHTVHLVNVIPLWCQDTVHKIQQVVMGFRQWFYLFQKIVLSLKGYPGKPFLQLYLLFMIPRMMAKPEGSE